MPKQFVVRQESENNWVIGFDIISIGPFATEAEAIQSAIKASSNAGKQNPAGSRVLVEQQDGTLRLVWTYGTDSPPG